MTDYGFKDKVVLIAGKTRSRQCKTWAARPT